MTSKELREQRNKLAAEMRALVQNGIASGEDQAKFDALDADQSKHKAQIDRIEKLESLDGELKEVRSIGIGRDTKGVIETAAVNVDEKRSQAFHSYLRGGIADMPSELRAYLTEARALSAVTGASGGYTVPTLFESNLVKTLKDFNGVRQAPVSVITTESGADFQVPTSDDTSNKGELIGENTQTASNEQPTFGQVTLKSFNFSSKTVLVPIQLLQDNAVNLDVELPALLGERIGRNQQDYFTTGTGTSQPEGIVTGASNSSVTLSIAALSTGGTVYDKLMDIIHSVDPAYRRDPSTGFMFNDSTLKVLKKLKDSQNRPLWASGLAVNEPDTINGYPYWINQSMADTGTATNKAILFGAFRYYRVRDVRGVQVLRLNERYADYFQVGFLGFQRSDGRHTNSAAIKYAAMVA